MRSRLPKFTVILICLLSALLINGEVLLGRSGSASWRGVLRGPVGVPLAGATLELREARSGSIFTRLTDSAGIFDIAGLPAGDYSVSARWQGDTAELAERVEIGAA